MRVALPRAMRVRSRGSVPQRAVRADGVVGLRQRPMSTFASRRVSTCPPLTRHLFLRESLVVQAKGVSIIGMLREAKVGRAQMKTVPNVVRKLGVTEQTYYRWKRE